MPKDIAGSVVESAEAMNLVTELAEVTIVDECCGRCFGRLSELKGNRKLMMLK